MDIKKNITTIFMVPTLNIDKDCLKNNNLINGYIQDVRRDVQYEDCVYLLFKPNNLDYFKEFLENEYDRAKGIVEDYDYENGLVVIVYKLDPKFKKDFALVKQGLYSKTSIEFQKLFPRIVKLIKNGLSRDEISLQYRVFNKTEDLKQYWEEKIGIQFDENMEVWTGFDEDNEILNVDKIKEYV
jgi:hypothetical protein